MPECVTRFVQCTGNGRSSKKSAFHVYIRQRPRSANSSKHGGEAKGNFGKRAEGRERRSMAKIRAHNLTNAQIPPLFSRMTTLTSAHVHFLLQPCVYRFMRDGEVIYVGSSKNGIVRVLCKNHHAKEARKLADEIEIEWFRTESAARIEERRQISNFKPRYNVFGNDGNTSNSAPNMPSVAFGNGRSTVR
jgi:hypothetical protein